jgi:hypothetical protein
VMSICSCGLFGLNGIIGCNRCHGNAVQGSVLRTCVLQQYSYNDLDLRSYFEISEHEIILYSLIKQG